MSGKNCFEILEKIFIPKTKEPIENIKGYTIKYGNIVENNENINYNQLGFDNRNNGIVIDNKDFNIEHFILPIFNFVNVT